MVGTTVHQNAIPTLDVCNTCSCTKSLFYTFFPNEKNLFIKWYGYEAPVTKMSTVLSLNPHLPSNVLYGDTFGEWDALLGPSVGKHGNGSGFIRQEDCRSRTLLGLWGCKGREDTDWTTYPSSRVVTHLTDVKEKQISLKQTCPGSVSGYRNSTEDNLAISTATANAYILWSSNSILG